MKNKKTKPSIGWLALAEFIKVANYEFSKVGLIKPINTPNKVGHRFPPVVVMNNNFVFDNKYFTATTNITSTIQVK